MSIDAFSRKVGISARQIIRYERDKYQNTNSSTLRKILDVLNIHLDGKILAKLLYEEREKSSLIDFGQAVENSRRLSENRKYNH